MKKSIIFLGFLSLLFLFGCKEENNDNPDRQIDGLTATGAAVQVMDTTTVAQKLEQITADGNVIFNNLSAGETPEKGDIIVSAPSEAAPQGFLYKVKEVKTSNGKTTIVTEPATLEEAVKEATVNESFELVDYITDVVKTEGVIIEGLQQSNLRAANDISTGVNIKVDKTVKFNNKFSATIKGSFDYKATFNCQMDFKDWSLKYLELTVKPQFKAKLTAGIEGSFKDSAVVNIATFQMAPITIWVGVVPLVVNPVISIDALITVKGEVKLQATLVELDYAKTYGIKYQNDVFGKIKEDNSKPDKFLDDAQLALSGEVKLEPQLSYKFKIYNTESYLGLYAGFYTKLTLDDLKFDVNWAYGLERLNPKLKLTCGISVGPEAKLELFSKKIAEWKPTVDLITWNIWERSAFPEFSITGFEEISDNTISVLYSYKGSYLIFPTETINICFSDNPVPTNSSNITGSIGLTDPFFGSTPWAETSNYNFTVSMSRGIRYYFRPYITNMLGTFYGEQKDFIIER